MLSPKRRMAVLSRDNYTCQLCGRKGGDGVKLEVDHIIPKSKGGKDELNNLRTLCRECNIGKGKCYDKDIYKDELIKDIHGNIMKLTFKYRNEKGMGTLSKGTIVLLSTYISLSIEDEITNYIFNSKIIEELPHKDTKEAIKETEEYDRKLLSDDDINIICEEILLPITVYIIGAMRYEGWFESSSYDQRFNFLLSENILWMDGKEGLVRKYTSMSKNELNNAIEIVADNTNMEGTLSSEIFDKFIPYI